MSNGRSGTHSRKIRKIRNLDQLAELTGFSKATVSRAMANSPLISEATIEKIQSAANAHGFRVNRNARRLRGITHTVAVALDFPALEGKRLSDPFHFELLADVAKALALREREVLLCSPKMDEERGYQDLIAARGADGIIFLGQGSRERYLKELSRSDVPFVVWGAVKKDNPYCAVGTDNYRGGWLVGQRFAALRRKTVLFVGATGSVEFSLRRAGLEGGLRDNGSDARILDAQALDLSYESSLLAVRHWFGTEKARVDAVFAASDTTAMAVYVVLRERGLGIPDDVSVVGYDDIPFASYLIPALTTIRQSTSQGGALLVEKLMHRLDGHKPASASLPTELIVRAS